MEPGAKGFHVAQSFHISGSSYSFEVIMETIASTSCKYEA